MQREGYRVACGCFAAIALIIGVITYIVLKPIIYSLMGIE